MSRSRVVLPHPDGPSSTRYSPSPVARSRSSTAGVALPTNCLVRCLTSTVATMKFLWADYDVPPTSPSARHLA